MDHSCSSNINATLSAARSIEPRSFLRAEPNFSEKRPYSEVRGTKQENKNSMARIVEFYVPKNHSPKTQPAVSTARGKVIEFSARSGNRSV